MTTRSRTLGTLTAGIALGFFGALAGGVFAERAPIAQEPRPRTALPWEEASLFAEVYERIKRDYVDDIDDHALMEKAVRGMVAALDSHSAYLDSSEFEEVRLSTMGSYPGVGIEVAAGDGVVRILKPLDGSPAQLAGLKAGDAIVRINDHDVGADVAGAIAHLRGPSGSHVQLAIRRDGASELMSFDLRRAEVEVRSVTQQSLEPGYGYVRITTFTETTALELRHAIVAIKRDNRDALKGLILDLRNNPGGVLEAGVAVAEDFLPGGVIVTADGRTPESRFRMDAVSGDLLNGAPLVVLVNGGSASASEIVAGALKDHGRALLVGHRTYGKGSVQTVMPLAHGGALKLTTSRYFTPSGASIQGKGLVPDVIESGPDVAPAPLAVRDKEVRTALQALKGESGHPHHAAPKLTARNVFP
ncbi:MAG TPA: S41 family peptidase [Steroidobacteraceae bacterium]|jgi:carboxyl-terminal processing protease